MKDPLLNLWNAAVVCMCYRLIAKANAAVDQALPITPTCGTSSSTRSVNFNSGIQLDKISTIYVFGDSLSATGNHHGGSPPPPVPDANRILYGGRASNGYMWNEVLLTKPEVKVSNFAIGGAVIDRTLYTNVKPSVSDMPAQAQVYLDQNLTIDPESSLTSVYFGVNDYSAAMKDKTAERTLPLAAESYLLEIEKLIKSGMKQFLILTPPYKRDVLLEHNKIIWDGMLKFQESDNIKFAHVEMSDLFQKIAEDPQSFGFVDNASCLTSMTTAVGGCTDPKVHPFWFPGHPAAEAQKLVAQYITLVTNSCEGRS